jgi:hypothetical protein
MYILNLLLLGYLAIEKIRFPILKLKGFEKATTKLKKNGGLELIKCKLVTNENILSSVLFVVLIYLLPLTLQQYTNPV